MIVTIGLDQTQRRSGGSCHKINLKRRFRSKTSFDVLPSLASFYLSEIRGNSLSTKFVAQGGNKFWGRVSAAIPGNGVDGDLAGESSRSEIAGGQRKSENDGGWIFWSDGFEFDTFMLKGRLSKGFIKSQPFYANWSQYPCRWIVPV